MKPLHSSTSYQSILIGTKWNSGFLLPHKDTGCYLIEVSANVVLEPISDQYFIRQNSLRLVFNYATEIGVREVARKIVSRRKEKARNAKAMIAGLGRVLAGPVGGIPVDSTVFFIGTNHPYCSELVSVPSELVRVWHGAQQFHDNESIRHVDWREHNLSQKMPALHTLRGWSPYSGLRLDCAACTAALDEVEARLLNVDWSSCQRFSRTKDLSEKPSLYPSYQRDVESFPIHSKTQAGLLKPQSAKLKPKELSAVLYGLGNYAKTIILPNTPRGICIKSIHEIDTTQIGPFPSSQITWSTAPYPASDERTDVYFVAGFHHTHTPIAVHALRHGAVAVVEKPICTTRSQLAELLEAMCNGGKLYACFHKRYLPFNDFALEDLGQPAGAPINYHCIVYEVPLPALHWYNWPNSCTRLVSNGCHWIDHFLYLNQFSSVQSASVKPFTDGSLNVTIESMNGAVFTMTLTDVGSNRVGVQDYIELRGNGVTVKMTNGSEYLAEGRNRILRRKRMNKMLTYHLMYRTIGQHILEGKSGDSPESVACSAGVILNLEDQLGSLDSK